MLKMHSKLSSDIKMQDARYRIQDKKNHASCIVYHVSFLLFIACCLLFLTSCSTKRVEMPSYEGLDVRELIAERNGIESVAATFSVEFEKNDSTITGDAALELTDNSLDLRIYSLGFLVAEVTEADGVVKSNPELNRNKSMLLVDGLRNGIFWWRIRDYDVEEQNGMYQLRNSWQRILIDKKTMLPTYQLIELDNGRELSIFYGDPLNSGKFWYPSRMKIKLSRYVVRLQIKSISFMESSPEEALFIPHSAQDRQQRPL